MFSVNSAISFFVNRKFGFAAVLNPAMVVLNKNMDPESEAFKKSVEIETYEKTLKAMPVSELQKLYNDTLAMDAEHARKQAIQEENARFYNLQSANADFVHWSKSAHWTIDEAIALSFGKEPEIVTWQAIEQFKSKSTFVKAFAKRRDLALRAACWKRFDGVLPPLDFLSWAQELQIELPPELVEQVSKIAGSAVDWHKMYLGQKADFDQLVEQLNQKAEDKQKPESTRKSENLLQALSSVAVDAYGYDPKSAKSTAPQDIADALAKCGKKVDPKTIRAWLKEGNDLLPQNPDLA